MVRVLLNVLQHVYRCWLVYVTFGTMYSVIRIHLAYCVTFGTMYLVFRIHLAYYVTFGTMYSVIRIHLARLRYLRHNVFGFSHTLAYCVTFGTMYSVIRIHLAYCVTFGTMYSVIRIHLARLRYLRHNVFGFSHTLAYCVTFGTMYSVFRIYWLIYATFGTMYLVFRIHLARLRYLRHNVFGYSHTFGSFTPSAQCIRLFAYIWLVYIAFGTMYSVIRIHLGRLRYLRHNVFGYSNTFVRKLD
ncbi:hypothetical protein M2444_000156 [Paenibacillus sp. PastF-3]|nr:hypothetical protein [Paenibacillus sp. PastF-3]